MLKPLPDREEFEWEIRGFIDNGVITESARFLQTDRTGLSKMLNPGNPDRHNPFWWSLSLKWAFDAQGTDIADKILDASSRRRMLWLPSPAVCTDPSKTTSLIGRELMDLMEKELAKEPTSVLLKEAIEIKDAVECKIKELLARQGV